MKYYKTDEILAILKSKRGLGYDYIIDKLYYEDGLVALKDLELAFLADKEVNGLDAVEKYLEDKIKQCETIEEEIIQQRRLDIVAKKRFNKTYWFTFWFGIVGGFCGIISLVIKINEEYLQKKEQQQYQSQGKNISSLNQSLSPDSKNTATLSSPTATKN